MRKIFAPNSDQKSWKRMIKYQHVQFHRTIEWCTLSSATKDLGMLEPRFYLINLLFHLHWILRRDCSGFQLFCRISPSSRLTCWDNWLKSRTNIRYKCFIIMCRSLASIFMKHRTFEISLTSVKIEQMVIGHVYMMSLPSWHHPHRLHNQNSIRKSGYIM